MRVLIVFGHPNPKSFNNAVLESFSRGLKDGGHSFEISNLYTQDFNPSFRDVDFLQFQGKPMPADVQAEQKKLANADALVIIGPVLGWFIPAILEGWLQRIMSWGFAWTADKDGMHGHLKHEKGLYIFTTGNPEEFYESTGLGAAMSKILHSTLTEAGIKSVETVFLYQVSAVDDATRQQYLDRVYRLGKGF
ncbi:MAG: NAD(P)H-dependent oxidoreductase [Methanobacteriota archaeon]|nr:MAG: NAD(P)H-dependent oxidoreductase [Euryarchaeota archaeon]